MGRRTILILLIVIIIVVGGGVAAFLYFNNSSDATATAVGGGDGVSADGGEGISVPAPTLPAMVEVVVSLQTLPRGYQITADDLDQLVTTDMRLASEVDENALTNPQEVIGLYARIDIFQGQTMTLDTFVSDPRLIGAEQYGPSSLIPEGSVAAAVPMDRLSSVAYGLRPGDNIDIMVTFLFYQIDEEFQTYLQNEGVFYLQQEGQATTGQDGATEVGVPQPDILILSPFGRFEELPTGDLAHVAPSEFQRPIMVSMVLQNAKAIQVGNWTPREKAALATPTPVPVEGEATPTSEGSGPPPTPTPTPPDVLVLALSPQQQLLLKYAIESEADIDFALRGPGDSQIYNIENVDLALILERFGINPPPDFTYSVDKPPALQVTATPPGEGEETGQ